MLLLQQNLNKIQNDASKKILFLFSKNIFGQNSAILNILINLELFNG